MLDFKYLKFLSVLRRRKSNYRVVLLLFIILGINTDRLYYDGNWIWIGMRFLNDFGTEDTERLVDIWI
jgi:hypothetical protein